MAGEELPRTGHRVAPIGVEGRRASPPEDCGGPWGYADHLNAIRDPQHKPHECLPERRRPFDPEAFDAKLAVRELRKTAKRRQWLRQQLPITISAAAVRKQKATPKPLTLTTKEIRVRKASMSPLASLLLGVVLTAFFHVGSPQALASPTASPGEAGVGAAHTRTGMFATEVWLTPLILLPGVALLIVSTAARFGQLQTEIHRLFDHPDAHAMILSRHLLRRSALFRDALIALYVSVGLFGVGSLLGGVVNIWRPESLWIVGGATMCGIGCIVYGAIQLIREAMICLQVIVGQTEELQETNGGKTA